MQINIVKLDKDAKIPTHGSEGAAGYDLYVTNSADIPVGESTFFHTGIAMKIPHGYFGAIYPRSGMACKKGLRLSNSCAVIDEDYIGEIMLSIHNDSKFAHRIEAGDRVAQIVIQPYSSISFYEVPVLEETKRSTNGFGSTGIQ